VPYRHQLQSSRFELKYLISEPCARGIRNFLRSHLEVDQYAQPGLGYAYSISSLYLDSSDWVLFRQTIDGLKNRFKLRIRFYDNDAESPAYLEIKRRETDVIRKERAAVTREGVRRLLSGQSLDESFLIDGNGNKKSAKALQNFCHLCDYIGAGGRVYVSYIREAYVSPDSDRVRVTFDRDLVGSPYVEGTALARPSQETAVKIRGVIMELKFTDRFPGWMRELVQSFSLQRCSIPKYIHCVEATGRHHERDLTARLGANR